MHILQLANLAVVPIGGEVVAFVHTSNHDFSGRPPSALQVARRAIGINVVAGRAAGLAETNWNRHVALRSKP